MGIEEYIAHLISSPNGNSCVKAGEVLEVSHDQVTRLLNNEAYSGRDLFEKAFPNLIAQGGTLTVDDSVIDKPYSNLETNELVGKYWSGKHHKTVKGVNLIVLVYTDINDCCLPVNYRLYDPNDVKTKHDLLQQMLKEVIHWGLAPKWFTADSWYSSISNLKYLRSLGINFQVGVKSDRIVSTQKGVHEQVGQIDFIPEQGLITHLKKFGFIKLFRTTDPDNTKRHYIVFETDANELHRFDRQDFKQIKKRHWNVENLFRALKQVCNLERFFVRKAQAVNNHIFAALRAFQRITCWAKDQIFKSIYAIRSIIFLNAQRAFIKDVVA